ncbi:hypothetical protein ABID59_005347 [Bradyrhizobium sp. S3.3.6]
MWKKCLLLLIDDFRGVTKRHSELCQCHLVVNPDAPLAIFPTANPGYAEPLNNPACYAYGIGVEHNAAPGPFHRLPIKAFGLLSDNSFISSRIQRGIEPLPWPLSRGELLASYMVWTVSQVNDERDSGRRKCAPRAYRHISIGLCSIGQRRTKALDLFIVKRHLDLVGEFIPDLSYQLAFLALSFRQQAKGSDGRDSSREGRQGRVRPREQFVGRRFVDKKRRQYLLQKVIDKSCCG